MVGWFGFGFGGAWFLGLLSTFEIYRQSYFFFVFTYHYIVVMPTLENREGALLVTQVSECLGHLVFRQTLLVKIKLQNMTLQVISCLVFILSFFKL